MLSGKYENSAEDETNVCAAAFYQENCNAVLWVELKANDEVQP